MERAFRLYQTDCPQNLGYNFLGENIPKLAWAAAGSYSPHRTYQERFSDYFTKRQALKRARTKYVNKEMNITEIRANVGMLEDYMRIRALVKPAAKIIRKRMSKSELKGLKRVIKKTVENN